MISSKHRQSAVYKAFLSDIIIGVKSKCLKVLLQAEHLFRAQSCSAISTLDGAVFIIESLRELIDSLRVLVHG